MKVEELTVPNNPKIVPVILPIPEVEQTIHNNWFLIYIHLDTTHTSQLTHTLNPLVPAILQKLISLRGSPKDGLKLIT